MSRDSCYPRLTTRREAEEEDEEYEDGDWMTSFCGCLADPASCCLTMFCPCVAVGMVAQKLDRGTTHWLTGAIVWLVLQEMTTLGCLYSCHYRKKLRERYNLKNRPLPDPLVHWICWPCAICQELRELKARETAYYGFGDNDRRVVFYPPGPQIMGRR
ncbi:unnamed protein product [Calypogeia fissa]